MLDPRRIGLNAADIGFQKRLKQDLDWGAVDTALQTEYNNQNSAVDVRREREAAKNEIHIMGGESMGHQSNDLLLTLARQERQINGYPLRHFSASNPAVVLPKKYGGFPLYNRNQVEYPELVSVFTEPMSAPLQRDTELLGRMGKVQLSHSLNTPFEADGYLNPMTQTHESLLSNTNEFTQRRHLQNMSERSQHNRYGTHKGHDSGIFIGKNGEPISTASDAIQSEMQTNNAFAAASTNFTDRAASIQSHHVAVQLPRRNTGPNTIHNMFRFENEGTPSGSASSTQSTPLSELIRQNYDPVTGRDNRTLLQGVEEDILTTVRTTNPKTPTMKRLVNSSYNESYTTPMTSDNRGFQEGELIAAPSTKRGQKGKKYSGAYKTRWLNSNSSSAIKYKAQKDAHQASKEVYRHKKSYAKERGGIRIYQGTPARHPSLTAGAGTSAVNYAFGSPGNKSIATARNRSSV
jgi:hypothetical protein